LERLHSSTTIEMETIPTCIDGELNTLAMGFQRMTKDDSLSQCTTLSPPINLVVFVTTKKKL
jgi:hypothetical protein